jgi:hypothetical protein
MEKLLYWLLLFQAFSKRIQLLLALISLLKLAKLIRNTNEYLTKRNFHTLTWNTSKSKDIKVVMTGENIHCSYSLLSPQKPSKSSANPFWATKLALNE